MDPLEIRLTQLEARLDQDERVLYFHKHQGSDQSQILSTANLGGVSSASIISALGYTPVAPFSAGAGILISGSGTLASPYVIKDINTMQTYSPSAAGTATIDLSLGNLHQINMPAGNITIALSNGTVGQCFILRIVQDGTGSRTVTWFTTIKWAGGIAPVLTVTASKIDDIGFVITGTNTYDGGPVFQNL